MSHFNIISDSITTTGSNLQNSRNSTAHLNNATKERSQKSKWAFVKICLPTWQKLTAIWHDTMYFTTSYPCPLNCVHENLSPIGLYILIPICEMYICIGMVFTYQLNMILIKKYRFYAEYSCLGKCRITMEDTVLILS